MAKSPSSRSHGIDREGYRTWAAEWVEGRLLHEGVTVGPDEKAAIWSALGAWPVRRWSSAR